MKRRYNKNNLKRKRRTKMRSKIRSKIRSKMRSKVRSKVYKRTKKKRLSKKKRQQFAGAEKTTLRRDSATASAAEAQSDVGSDDRPGTKRASDEGEVGAEKTTLRRALNANSQLIMSSGDEDIDEVQAASEHVSRYTDGIQVLLKINNGYKKCRKLKFEKEEQGHFRVVFYAVGDNDAETVKESFYCGVWLSEGETVSVVGDNIVINRRSRRYEITPVGNCTRSEKLHLPAFFGGKGSRFSDDTSSGSSSVTTENLERIFDLIKAAEKAKEDQIRDLQNEDSEQSHGTL